jgi:hypothetical protein
MLVEKNYLYPKCKLWCLYPLTYFNIELTFYNTLWDVQNFFMRWQAPHNRLLPRRWRARGGLRSPAPPEQVAPWPWLHETTHKRAWFLLGIGRQDPEPRTQRKEFLCAGERMDGICRGRWAPDGVGHDIVGVVEGCYSLQNFT